MINLSVKRFIKYTALLLFGLFTLYGSGRMGLNYTGYCMEQQRYLTDQEKITIAVNDLLRSYPPVVDIYKEIDGVRIVTDRNIPINPIQYESTNEFFEINKNCCQVRDYGKGDFGGEDAEQTSPISLFSKLTGNISSHIHINYQVRYVGTDNEVVVINSRTAPAITNCGKIWSGI